MKIILRDDVVKVGAAGETRNVSDGFARNYLFPKKLAMPATPSNLRKWESEKKLHQTRLAQTLESAQQLAQSLEGLTLDLTARSGREGHLFGSVTSQMISEALLAKGFTIEKKNIVLETSIKSLGEYQVPIRLHSQVTATLKIKIISSTAEPTGETDALADEEVQAS